MAMILRGVYVIAVPYPGSFCGQCFFLSGDFLAAFLDALAHLLQGLAGTSGSGFDPFGCEFLIFLNVSFVSGDDLFVLCCL